LIPIYQFHPWIQLKNNSQQRPAGLNKQKNTKNRVFQQNVISLDSFESDLHNKKNCTYFHLDCCSREKKKDFAYMGNKIHKNNGFETK